jgi:hypothetical protein
MTNENSPLTDRTSRNLARALVALIVILTCADLVLGERAWFNEQQQCLAVESNDTLLAQLQDMTQTHLMLCRINAGKTDEVMGALHLKLSNEVHSLYPSLISADDDTRNLARTVYLAVARSEKKRFNNYSINAASTGSNEVTPAGLHHPGQRNLPPGMAQNN